MSDVIDAQILHALVLAPRLPFRSIGAVVGTSEQTVARRYQRLRREGVVRVVGLVNQRGPADAHWVARIHTKPDRMPQLAEALVRRSEVTHANILSGGTELVCVVRAPLGEDRESVLLQALPRTTSVLGISVDLVLHSFGEPSTAQWTGYGHKLSSAQVDQVLGASTVPAAPGPPIEPVPEDGPMLDALAQDGRTPLSQLARRTGWSVARVGRRIAALESSGTLAWDVDVLPERLGYQVSAMLWFTVTPKYLHSVGEQIAAHDEIAFVGAVSGRANLMAIVICRDVDDLYRYLAERLATVDHVQGYDVSIRTRRLKQSASIIAGGRLIPRRT